MPKRKKKGPDRRPVRRERSGPAAAPTKRRLPRPMGGPEPGSSPASGQPEVDQPHVLEAVQHIREVCALTRLSPHQVMADWVGMLEASLRLYGENMKAMALTGQFVDDPPEVKAHFKQARERYLRAAEHYPAAYRAMQTAFAGVSDLLMVCAEPGLAGYGQQSTLNPDVIGQIYLTLVEPGPAWARYFPAWRETLLTARDLYSEADELIHTALARADLKARQAGDPAWVQFEAGVNYEAWFEAIVPYLEPVIIGPADIDSSAKMLAIAAQFPTWAVQHGLVKFVWAGVDPLLLKMARINQMLYGLNGYDLALAQTAEEIATVLAQRLAEPRPPDRPAGPPVDDQAQPSRPDPDRTFEMLFRKTNR
ncbi:MAG TPA: hypothetical protein VGD99_11895 [Anaerolineae bacterium]